MESRTLSWLGLVKETLGKEGKLEATLKSSTYLIEWKRGDILAKDLAAFKREVAPLAKEEISASELEFLKAHPEFAEKELFLKPSAPHLKSEMKPADWEAERQRIGETIGQFYLADIAKFGPHVLKALSDDLYVFATVKKKGKDESLGFLLFAITPALPFGDIKIINLVSSSSEQKKGLEGAMLSLVFKLVPHARRLILFARPTNKKALELYGSLGFQKDEHPFQDPMHPIDTRAQVPMEYRAEDSTLLQSGGLALTSLKE